ncbi:hypothetical protein V1477_015375 [Vespula maculifrons]|uniref:Uncharacterized protein n=1 Tax=Vespula maculifrons TaxID=7453 RepID=A0ABD2BFM2_VESMC
MPEPMKQQHLLLGRKPSEFDLYVAGDDGGGDGSGGGGGDSGGGGGGATAAAAAAAAAVAIVRKTTPVTPATGFSTRERLYLKINSKIQTTSVRTSEQLQSDNLSVLSLEIIGKTQVPEIALEISRLNYAEFPSVGSEQLC